jgi:hypothetical protein
MHNTEDCRIGPDAKSEREDGDRGEARIFPHHAERVREVAHQDVPMFSRRGGENPQDCFFPELQRIQKATSFSYVSLLLSKDAFHFTFIIDTEIKGQQSN